MSAVKLQSVLNERKGKDAAWLLTHPRELCKDCWEWSVCSDEPWDDMSGCTARIHETYNEYLLGVSNDCRYHCKL